MPESKLAHFVLLPELKLEYLVSEAGFAIYKAVKQSSLEVCPKCATPSSSVYDRRKVRIKDAPLRAQKVWLHIIKRRFWCKGCKKPFTEPIPGISKGKRHTHRYKRHLHWACERFSDLKSVKQHLGCSYSFLYKAYYERCAERVKQRAYPWPSAIGIDEHRFRRNPKHGGTDFTTIVVDHKKKKIYGVVNGRSNGELKQALSIHPGAENVHWATMDLSPTYRSFVRCQFPNARIIADKFHVVRLLTPHLNRYRKAVAGDRRSNPLGKLLLRDFKNLSYFEKFATSKWLDLHPEIKELHHWKQALHSFYRIKGYQRARKAFIKMLDQMARSKLKEIKTLRRTLQSWSKEILNYFLARLTNGRVEGFNNKAKLIRKRGYGYRSFKNYRLKLLNACY